MILDGGRKPVHEIAAVARGEKVSVSEETLRRMAASRRIIDDMVERGATVYGVTTGFGKFADVPISRPDIKTLQKT